ncbi:MAG: ammonium transporter, partial [Bacillota bacterium]|nr:ammonium transporter [Bacillota bacterium]
GFTMLEIGFTRAKNAVNIIMKNMLTISVGAVTFFLVGFGLMFGDSIGGFLGYGKFFMIGVEELDFGIPTMAFWVFQAVFAATAATIVSGAVAERIKFSAYFLFTIILTAVIYPIVGHWIWGGGWLGAMGFTDFAGSTVVHSTGGWAALVAAYFLGARIGKYSPDGKVNAIPGHNMPLGALGVMILWFGWFGFNTGSTIAGTDAAIAPIAAVTLLGAAAGTLSTIVYTWIRYGKPDPSLVLNGALAGLVAITAGAAAVSPVGAMLMGAIGGIIMVEAVSIIDRKIKVDDPVGAISVHGITGAFGTIAVGLFALDGGLLYGNGAELLVVQLIGVVSVLAFVGIASVASILLIKATVGLRVPVSEEEEGLDVGEHGLRAYGSLNNEKATATPVIGAK